MYDAGRVFITLATDSMHGQLLKVAVMEVRVALRNSTKVVPKLAKNRDYTH
jgi:hypothetical protein